MNVSTLVFLGLAIVWAIVLVPEALRKLSGVRSSDTIRSFNQQLAVLDRSGQRRQAERRGAPVGGRQASLSAPNVIDLDGRRAAVSAPAPRLVSPAVRRRRQEILVGLGAAALLTLVCTVAFGGPFLLLHLLADALLLAYVAALAKVNQAPAARQHAGSELRSVQLQPAHVRRTG